MGLAYSHFVELFGTRSKSLPHSAVNKPALYLNLLFLIFVPFCFTMVALGFSHVFPMCFPSQLFLRCWLSQDIYPFVFPRRPRERQAEKHRRLLQQLLWQNQFSQKAALPGTPVGGFGQQPGQAPMGLGKGGAPAMPFGVNVAPPAEAGATRPSRTRSRFRQRQPP